MKQKSVYFLVEPNQDSKNVSQIQQQLEQLPGVTSAYVNPQRKLVAIDYNSSQISWKTISQKLHAAGYTMISHSQVIQNRS